MRKFIAFILCLIISVSLISCKSESSNNKETTNEETTKAEITTQEETTAVPLSEYVTGEPTAEINDILTQPEIETDVTKLNNFYVKSENNSSFRGISTCTYNTLSVKGLYDDRTEFVFRQDNYSNVNNDMAVSVSATAVFIFDNVNKTAKVMMAQSMNTDLSDNEDVENQMNGIFSSFLTSGDFNDYSDRYTYDEALTYMKQILGMYSGIYFSEYLKYANPPIEFKKSADEGNCVVYYASINGESFKFKIDKETGLFKHAAYTTGDNLVVTEHSFSEHLHTEADIAVAEN